MRYLLMIADEENETNIKDDGSPMSPEYVAFMTELGESGVLQGGQRLRPTSDATSVRVRNGEVVTTDGPYVEAKEAMAGYFLIDCADLDAAVEVASKIPAALTGTIEVRPIWEM
jgi:hypothetical protein